MTRSVIYRLSYTGSHCFPPPLRAPITAHCTNSLGLHSPLWQPGTGYQGVTHMGRPLFGEQEQGELQLVPAIVARLLSKRLAAGQEENTHPYSCLCTTCLSTSSDTTPRQSSPLASTAVSDIRPSETPIESASPQVTSSDLVDSFTRTRDSLRRVSEALDNTYNILRTLRESLQSLSDQMSSRSSFSLPIMEDNTIGPGHSAIVLNPAEDSEAAGTTHSTSSHGSPSEPSNTTNLAMARLHEINQAFLAGHSRPLPPSPPQPRSPMTPARSREVVLTARTMLERFNRERRGAGNPDDASTLRGRRVAAREAAGRQSTSGSFPAALTPTQVAPPHLPPRTESVWEDSSDDDPPPLDFNPPPQFIARREPAEPTSDGDSSSATNMNPLGTPPYMTAMEAVRNVIRSGFISERTIELPPITLPDVPEWRGVLVRADVSEGDHTESRSYRVRRRLNSAGEEPVHRVDISDIDGDPMAWLVPTPDRLEPVPIPPSPSARVFTHPVPSSALERAMGARRSTAALVPVGIGSQRGWCQCS